MTEKQFEARQTLKKCRQYMTSQQIRTLNGQIKSGNIEAAMNGMHTIMARKFRGD